MGRTVASLSDGELDGAALGVTPTVPCSGRRRPAERESRERRPKRGAGIGRQWNASIVVAPISGSSSRASGRRVE